MIPDFLSLSEKPQTPNIMNSKNLIKCGLPVWQASIGTAMMITLCLLPAVHAGPAPSMETMTPAPAPEWKWGISADYMYRDVDREEDYWSGPELWNVDYDDFDGDLWGFTAFVVPPCFFDIMFDFSYRTGDLDGRFTNYSINPPVGTGNPGGGPFDGDARFDRDEYVFGITIPCPAQDWLFARLEYFNFQEDGEWNYDLGGPPEKQEYTLWGISGGVGAKHEMPLGSTGAMLDLNAFLGLVYFDLEHEEVGGPTTDWSDWGFLGRASARISYPLQDQLDVFLGCGYEYLQTDDGDLDMTNQGVFVNLGLKGEF